MNTTETMPRGRAPSHGDHSRSPHFLVGRNRQASGWFVIGTRAAVGLFDSRAEALRFAFRERGEAPGAVVLVPDVLEFFEAPTMPRRLSASE